ncbi:MAG: acylphosphatase [Ottowia sp.]|nr:acylphosphatase [Ottowia sp.]
MTHDVVAHHLHIRGRVQGVAFRASMVAQARSLGVAGWVRNREDGSVEALVQGKPADVKHIIAWAHQGPPRASVSGVDATPVACQPLSGFRQRATA